MATRKTLTRTIGNLSYTATALGARAGAEGLRRLGTTFGPVLATAAAELRKGDDASKEAAVLGGIAKLVQNLSGEDLTYFIDLFGAATTVQSSPKHAPLVANVFDEIFSCDYLAMGEFLAMNLELNYGPFFQECWTRFQGSDDAAPAAPSTSPTT